MAHWSNIETFRALLKVGLVAALQRSAFFGGLALSQVRSNSRKKFLPNGDHKVDVTDQPSSSKLTWVRRPSIPESLDR